MDIFFLPSVTTGLGCCGLQVVLDSEGGACFPSVMCLQSVAELEALRVPCFRHM